MSQIPLKARFQIGSHTFSFEGTITSSKADIASVIQGLARDSSVKSQTEDQHTSERELVQAKRPENHSETVAVLAFSLAQAGQEEFTADDIKRGYIRAGVRPPKVIEQAIRDARNAHDYIEAGSTRGSYRLSNHGERVVRFDLPHAT